jgi:hypothetical protein
VGGTVRRGKPVEGRSLDHRAALEDAAGNENLPGDMIMAVRMVENFVAHPVTRAVDMAAVATGAAYVLPEWRAAIHEWGLIAGDIAPIFAVLWLAVQIICKIVVTRKCSNYGDDGN